MKTYVEEYIEYNFDANNFDIVDEPRYFQGKKLTDVNGHFMIIEAVPFSNAVIVHLNGETSKYIYDENLKDWVFVDF